MALLRGTAAGDTLLGGAEDDLIEGLEGKDSLVGGAGNDTLVGGRGYDTLKGGEGNDTFRFDSLEELLDYEWIQDMTLGDRIDVSAIKGLRIIVGEELPSGVVPSTQAPVLLLRNDGYNWVFDRAGSWRAWIYVPNASLEERTPGAGIIEVVKPLALSGTAGGDSLVGGRGADTLDGGDGDDVLRGAEGRDSLVGGAGNDILIGGRGFDTLKGGAGDDTFRYSVLEDLLDGDSIEDMALGDRIDLSAFAGLRVFVGNALPEGVIPTESALVIMLGDDGSVRIFDKPSTARATLGVNGVSLEERPAGSGLLQVVQPLVLTGTAGVDTLLGGRGNDSLDGGGGADSLVGAEGRDSLVGGAGNDTLVGGRGYDSLMGGTGNDTFRYDSLDDLLDGDWIQDMTLGDRIDLSAIAGLRIVLGDQLPAGLEPSSLAPVALLKSMGDVEVYVNSSSVRSRLVVSGAVLEERVSGSRVIEVVAPQLVSGTNSADRLTGGRAGDTLEGGEGPDTLIGGPGRDTLRGGAGSDTFVFRTLDELKTGDAIADFDDDDRIDLSAVTGLRVVFSTSSSTDLPAGTAAPTADAPVLVVSTTGILSLKLASGSPAELMQPINGQFMETAAGSKILMLAPAVNREGTAAADTLSGTARADTLNGGGGNDSLSGEGGADFLQGGTGNDTLEGDDGPDTLLGGAGNDYMKGGQGADRFVIDAVNPREVDDIAEFSSLDILDLTALKGLKVYKSATLPAGVTPSAASPVALIMGNGELRLYNSTSDFASVRVYGFQLERYMPCDLEETQPGSALLRLVEAKSATGTGMADTLRGGEGTDVINGYAGNDLIFGGAGVDVLLGGHGDDTLVASLGGDTLDGGTGCDVFRVDAISDMDVSKYIIAEPGELLDLSRIEGLRIFSGSNYVSGPGPAAWITDTGYVYFYDAASRYVGMISSNLPFVREGLPGTKTVVFSRTRAGTDGADSLVGSDRSETLEGGAGADTLVASAGTDRLVGGAGADVFKFTELAQLRDTTRVADLQPDDSLDFSAIPGLRIVVGDSLPSGVTPSKDKPVLLVKSNGFLDVYDGVSETFSSFVGSVDVRSGPMIAGNPRLVESSPGVLRMAPNSPLLETRWFDTSGQQRTDTSGAAYTLVMVADGYTVDQKDLFYSKVQQYAKDAFTSTASVSFTPFDTFKSLFQVVGIFVPSREPGMTDASKSLLVDNAFRSSYEAGRGGIGGDDARLMAFIDMNFGLSSSALPVLLLNAEYGRSNAGSRIWQLTPASGRTITTLVHEMGHAVFSLEDEYDELAAMNGQQHADTLSSVHLSLSATSVPWAHWWGYDDGLVGPIGAYEGGHYAETGVWRPTANSFMNSIYTAEVSFSAPQKEAMVVKLYELWGDYIQGFRSSGDAALQASIRLPSVLKMEWTIGGRSLTAGANTLSLATLADSGLPAQQRHLLELRTVDNTGMIRLPSLLDITRQSETIGALWGGAAADSLGGTVEADLLYGVEGDDRLQGLAGADMLFGGTGADWLDGGTGDDQLEGGDGADTLMGGPGNDVLSGGLGIDIAQFPGLASRYRLLFDKVEKALSLADRQAGAEGQDRLTDLETLKFDNREVRIESRTAPNFSDLPAELYQFFVVAFDAAPGVEYLAQIADAYRAGATVRQIVNAFVTKSQFTDTYPTNLSNGALALKLVDNIVGGSASAASKAQAVKDITAAMDAGLSVGGVVFTVFGNLAKKPLQGDEWSGTAQQFLNQIAVAKFYTEVMGQSTTDLVTLRSAVDRVTHTSAVGTDDQLVELIGLGLLGGGG